MTLWVLVFVFGVAAVAGLVALKLLARRFTDDIDNEMRETARGMTAAMELFTDEELREIADEPDARGRHRQPAGDDRPRRRRHRTRRQGGHVR